MVQLKHSAHLAGHNSFSTGSAVLTRNQEGVGHRLWTDRSGQFVRSLLCQVSTYLLYLILGQLHTHMDRVCSKE